MDTPQRDQHRELIVVGDRVLIKIASGDERTDTGLILPQSVTEKQQVHCGRVVAVGPGTPTASAQEIGEEPWHEPRQQPRYIPMQARVGDVALFMRKAAIEIKYHGEEYLIIPQAAILVVLRDEEELIRKDVLPGYHPDI